MMRRNERTRDEEVTYWLSYSDMMAGLLLAFVLIISLTVLHAKLQFDEKQEQLLGKEQELVVQAGILDEERATVAAQRAILDSQQKQLNAQEAALAEQGEQIALQEKTLREQHELLSQFEELMAQQQAKLDNIIGVRSDLIEALKAEFNDSNLHIAVDAQTGAITFDASILFDYNKFELKDTGKVFLSEFLQRYVNILMGEKYRDYVSEVLIEGHTDLEGDYLFNLDLSQKRAYSVAEYCLADNSMILDAASLEAFRSVVATAGRSYSNPVYDANGNVDMAASRRVDFNFHLKDEEMIREMISILNSENNAENNTSASAGTTAPTSTTAPANTGSQVDGPASEILSNEPIG